MARKEFRGPDGPTLFDPAVRRFEEPHTYGESSCQFYDRIEGPLWEEYRKFVDRCFRRLPKRERAQVAGQWRSGQDDQLAASWWEMLLHETFVTLGATIAAHTESKSGTRADFHVSGLDGPAFFLEAHRLGPSPEQRARGQRRDQLYAALNNIDFPGWKLHLRELNVGQLERDFSGWAQQIKDWLATLPPEKDSLALNDDGWHIELGAIPWEIFGYPYPTGILIYPAISGIEGIGDRVRKPILHKVARYPGLSPLVVAVSSSVFDMGESDVIAALCGATIFHLDQDLKPGRQSRSNDGLWFGVGGPRNRHLSAVALGNETLPGDLNHVHVEFWINPWAEVPMPNPCPMWETVRLDPTTLAVRREPPTVTFEEFFGLANGWGTAHPFPKLEAAYLTRYDGSTSGSEM